MSFHQSRQPGYSSLLAVAAVLAFPAFGQTAGSSPAAVTSPATPAVAQQPAQKPVEKEDKRIMGVIPNYRTVPSRDLSIPPLTAKQKFSIATKDSFDPPGFALAIFYAGVNQLEGQSPSWGQGVQGLAKRYVAGFADQAISNYLTEATIPSLLHQDPRYFRSHTGSAWRRAGYAASRVLIIRSDKGTSQFNFSEIVGTAGAVELSNLYYPHEERNWHSNLSKFTFQVGSDSAFNVVKEFWPEIRHKIFKNKKTETP